MFLPTRSCNIRYQRLQSNLQLFLLFGGKINEVGKFFKLLFREEERGTTKGFQTKDLSWCAVGILFVAENIFPKREIPFLRQKIHPVEAGGCGDELLGSQIASF